MVTVDEARAALEAEQGECWHERNGAEGRNHVMTKADTYAAARELKGHVAACEKYNETPDLPPLTPIQDYKCPDGSHHEMLINLGGAANMREVERCVKCGALNESVMMRRQASKSKPQRCGDGWLCDVAEKIKKLGEKSGG